MIRPVRSYRCAAVLLPGFTIWAVPNTWAGLLLALILLTGVDVKRLVFLVFGCSLCLGAASVAAGPIVVSLTGELGEDSPYGASGTPYEFSFALDDSAAPVLLNANGTFATYDGVVTGTSFSSELVSFATAPTNAAPDSNLLLVSDNAGLQFSEDLVQAFFDVPDQGDFEDLFFGLLLLDRHADGEPTPTSITSLGLDFFSQLDASDFIRDRDGPQTANNQFVFRGIFNGMAFSDFSSTITAITVTPGQATVPPSVPPGGSPTPPGASPVPEPGLAGLLLLGLMSSLVRRRRSASL